MKTNYLSYDGLKYGALHYRGELAELPENPTKDEVYKVGGKLYLYDGISWQSDVTGIIYNEDTDSIVEGLNTNSKATGINSHAEGSETQSIGAYSHAEGGGTIVAGNCSHSEGIQANTYTYNTHTYIEVDHIDGSYVYGYIAPIISDGLDHFILKDKGFKWSNDNTTWSDGEFESVTYINANTARFKSYYVVINDQSFATYAAGCTWPANPPRIIVKCVNYVASGDYSHTEGLNNVTMGQGSHAEGLCNIAYNDSEHAEGKYNASHPGTIHSVGVGSSDDRKNAIEVLNNGKVFIKGVGGYDGTNPSQASALQDVINNTGEALIKRIVDELPAQGEENVVYLTPSNDVYVYSNGNESLIYDSTTQKYYMNGYVNIEQKLSVGDVVKVNGDYGLPVITSIDESNLLIDTSEISGGDAFIIQGVDNSTFSLYEHYYRVTGVYDAPVSNAAQAVLKEQLSPLLTGVFKVYTWEEVTDPAEYIDEPDVSIPGLFLELLYGDNIKDEWMWIGGTWEKIGPSCYTRTETNDLLAEKVDKVPPEPLLFTALENNVTIGINNYSGNTVNLEISTDGTTWSTWEFTTITLATTDDVIYMRGSNPTGFSHYPAVSSFSITGRVELQGNIMSLIDYTNTVYEIPSRGCFATLFNGCVGLQLDYVHGLKLPATTLSHGCYAYMFNGCTNLRPSNHSLALELPATTLAPYCYEEMFSGCTNLLNNPALPATTLAPYCYKGMFRNCTSLISINGELIANVMEPHCYESMFSGCSALTTAPALPATTLADSCYKRMFGQCTNMSVSSYLTSLPATVLAPHCYEEMFVQCNNLQNQQAIPALPATTLADSCYKRMFFECYNFALAPALPAITLADNCYEGIFECCYDLTSAPTLPATTLAPYCYKDMFRECESLTTAPTLPATTLAPYCYQNMFTSCTDLVAAPTLPATTLAPYCYNGMFSMCSSLISTPLLHARTLVPYCYQDMFARCSHIVSATCLATDISATDCTNRWLNLVSSSGAFTKATGVTWTTGISGIPTNWAVTEQKVSENVTSTDIRTIWRGTEADYNLILTKDPNTLYIIITA